MWLQIGLSTEQRTLLHGTDFTSSGLSDGESREYLNTLLNIPAGDEATVESGAGGELEICQEMLDQLRTIP